MDISRSIRVPLTAIIAAASLAGCDSPPQMKPTTVEEAFYKQPFTAGGSVEIRYFVRVVTDDGDKFNCEIDKFTYEDTRSALQAGEKVTGSITTRIDDPCSTYSQN